MKLSQAELELIKMVINAERARRAGQPSPMDTRLALLAEKLNKL